MENASAKQYTYLVQELQKINYEVKEDKITQPLY